MTKDRWRELRRPVVRMRDALALVQLTVAGEPLMSSTVRNLEDYVKSMGTVSEIILNCPGKCVAGGFGSGASACVWPWPRFAECVRA